MIRSRNLRNERKYLIFGVKKSNGASGSLSK